MKTKNRFTKEQLKAWARYEDVRAGGKCNMFDSRARALTGLDRAEYIFVMEHYEALKNAFEQAT